MMGTDHGCVSNVAEKPARSAALDTIGVDLVGSGRRSVGDT